LPLSADLRDQLQESLGSAYTIERELGGGGMSRVFAATETSLGRHVVVKILPPELAEGVSVERFKREIQLAAQLRHPHIVPVLAAGVSGGLPYYTMPLEDGHSLRTRLAKSGPLPITETIGILRDVAKALAYAHERGVVHRDIKPDNILITRAGVAKLADLGLAKRTDETSHLTSMRQGFGTSHYMPYEQAFNARSADNRSDIYALGATLYHLAAGTPPFSGEQHMEIVEKKKQGDFPSIRSLVPETPAALDAIVSRMLARRPGDRYQSASALIVDLERSGLAASLPTFADPELAKNDPWIQTCLASSSERTRLDPNLPPRMEEPLPTAEGDVWLLRFRNRAGRVCKARATTDQIIERLRERRLPHRIVARRPSQPKYRPLAFFPEFQVALYTRREGKRKAAPVSAILPTAKGALPRRRWPLVAVVAALIVLGAALGVLIRFLFSR
jgi:eukaryotic-like serine/threonine-protein kinase